VSIPPAPEPASEWGEDVVSPNGQHAIRFLRFGPELVRPFDASWPTIPLGADTDELRQFQFSADSRWLVAEVAERGELDPWAIRIWNVADPESPRTLPQVELHRVQGNYLHLRARDDSVQIVPFDDTDEPLIVPKDVIAIGDDTVMYIRRGARPSDPRRPAIHLTRLDQSQESIVLFSPRSRVEQALYCGEYIVARLASGEMCVWDLTWRAVAARIRASTTASLTPEQRRRLLGETEDEAQSRWAQRARESVRR